MARVFVTKRTLLHTLGDFPKAWRLLLDHVAKLALSSQQEVNIAALKAFHEMVVSGGEDDGGEGAEDGGRWVVAWKTWLAIGSQATRGVEGAVVCEEGGPSQAFLTALAAIFPLLFTHLKNNFSPSDLVCLGTVITSCLSLPVTADSELGYLLTAQD